MILNYKRQWIVAVLLWLPKVNLQMPMQLMMPPMPPMPPMISPMMPSMYFPPPAPPPVPMSFPAPPPIAFQIVQYQEPKKTPTTEKSEKEEKTFGIAIPMSFPAPMQFAMPPSFPASPLAPSPPMPLPQDCQPDSSRSQPSGSQTYQVITARKARRHPRVWRDKSYEGTDFQGYSAELTSRKLRKRKRSGHGPRKSHYRKTYEEMNDDFAKPVLSYISNDGDVKLEKRLSEDEAAELMDERKSNQKVQIVAEEDSHNRQSVKVVSSIEDNKLTRYRSEPSSSHRRRQVVLKSGSMQHMLGEGKKELVFKPPNDKKISNLSVSFQIT